MKKHPAIKAHTLTAAPLTADTVNALSRLHPPPPPGDSTAEGAYLLHMSRTPPPGKTPTPKLGTGTPVHHVQGRPHPPHVDGDQARIGRPHQGISTFHDAGTSAHPVAHKCTASVWLTKALQALHRTMLGLRVWFRHFVA